jgi:hypothetical protein
MTEYLVKIGFWLRAYDSITIDANSDEEAVAKAKAAASTAMESMAQPEHVDAEERREGVIVYIDRITADAHHAVAEDVAFDDDRIHPSPPI